MLKNRGRPNPIQMAVMKNPDFAPTPQVACFNRSTKIGKHFLPDPNTSKMGVVPLYTLQKGSINEVPAVNQMKKLVAPMPVPSVIRMGDTTEEVNPAFPQYFYNDGIRPSVRPLLAFP